RHGADRAARPDPLAGLERPGDDVPGDLSDPLLPQAAPGPAPRAEPAPPPAQRGCRRPGRPRPGRRRLAGAGAPRGGLPQRLADPGRQDLRAARSAGPHETLELRLPTMPDVLLTHGYFLADDEKEREIMKPYPTLGLLYLSSFLRRAGFAVELFD